MKTDEFPRRIRLDRMVPAEKAIYNAMQEVEKLSADVKLTEAVTLLSRAKDLVSDFIDDLNRAVKEGLEKTDETNKIIASMRDIDPEKPREPFNI